MSGVEFICEADDDDAAEPVGGRSRVRPRLLVGVVALAVVVAGAVVVGNGRGHAHRAAGAPGPSRSASPSALPSHSLLTLSDAQLFGPPAVDLVVTDDRVFALTPTLVGFADRDGGVLTVRPAPTRLSNQAGHGKLLPDFIHLIVWVVAIGGTAIGSYDTDHLDTLSNTVAPYRINGAVAMDEKLYFTTDHGLYSAEAGPGKPVRVPGPTDPLGAVSADSSTHEVIAADNRSPNRVHVLTSYGLVRTATFPFAHVDTIAVTDGRVWIGGRGEHQASLFEVTQSTLQPMRSSPLTPQLGQRAAIVATFGDRLLVRGYPDPTLYCVDATNGRLKQKWTAPLGAAGLDERGVLITSREGIEQFNARDCLA